MCAHVKCTNTPELNQYVEREYRKSWTLQTSALPDAILDVRARP